MLRSCFLGLVALGWLLSGSTAEAGCLHLCDLSLDPPVVAPALPCVTVESKAQTCNCAVQFEIRNLCQSDIQALEGTVFTCRNSGKTCTTLAPKEDATGEILIKALVPADVSIKFSNQGTDYKVVVWYDAAPRDQPWSLCAMGPGRPSHPPAALLILLGAAWPVLWIRRRRKAKTPRRS